VTPFFLHSSLSWVKIRHTKFNFLGCLEVVDFCLEKGNKEQVSMKLMAFLAPGQARVEAGDVAKADQYKNINSEFIYLISCLIEDC
jgi:hypothetical protein